MVQANLSLIDTIRQEGLRCYPQEACGLVVRKGKKSEAVACRNISLYPEDHFLISPEDYAATADRGEIIGIWHTHVNLPSEPSDADLAGCEASELPWYIMGISRDADDQFHYAPLKIVEPTQLELPYLERPYVFGILDCYSLVRDYFKREYEIILKEAPRIEKWWLKGFNFFEDMFEDVGFSALKNKEPLPGDLFLIQMGADVSNHIAIYIGNDMILHHCYGRLSTRDIYGGYWQKHTAFHLRYRDFL